MKINMSSKKNCEKESNEIEINTMNVIVVHNERQSLALYMRVEVFILKASIRVNMDIGKNKIKIKFKNKQRYKSVYQMPIQDQVVGKGKSIPSQ